MTFSETNKEKHLRRIKSTVTQSQVQESNDGHPLGKMLSGKMLAPSPAFQKALLGIYHMLMLPCYISEPEFGGHGQLRGGKGRGTPATGKLVAWKT